MLSTFILVCEGWSTTGKKYFKNLTRVGLVPKWLLKVLRSGESAILLWLHITNQRYIGHKYFSLLYSKLLVLKTSIVTTTALGMLLLVCRIYVQTKNYMKV